jgi:hypothetical protein
MRFKSILLIVFAVAAAVQAQESASQRFSEGEPQAVVNEDRGIAFIIPLNTDPVSLQSAQKGNAIAEPQQHSVFLGKGWQSEKLRDRELQLANLMSNMSDPTRLAALEKLGVKNTFAANDFQEKLIDLETRDHISDLQIQAILTSIVRDNPPLHSRFPTIYVVYLDPSLQSTLADLIAGKHYAAYFNSFNFSGNKIRYLVVPFQSNLKSAYEISLNGFLFAVLNPDRAK